MSTLTVFLSLAMLTGGASALIEPPVTVNHMEQLGALKGWTGSSSSSSSGVTGDSWSTDSSSTSSFSNGWNGYSSQDTTQSYSFPSSSFSSLSYSSNSYSSPSSVWSIPTVTSADYTLSTGYGPWNGGSSSTSASYSSHRGQQSNTITSSSDFSLTTGYGPWSSSTSNDFTLTTGYGPWSSSTPTTSNGFSTSQTSSNSQFTLSTGYGPWSTSTSTQQNGYGVWTSATSSSSNAFSTGTSTSTSNGFTLSTGYGPWVSNSDSSSSSTSTSTSGVSLIGGETWSSSSPSSSSFSIDWNSDLTATVTESFISTLETASFTTDFSTATVSSVSTFSTNYVTTVSQPVTTTVSFFTTVSSFQGSSISVLSSTTVTVWGSASASTISTDSTVTDFTTDFGSSPTTFATLTTPEASASTAISTAAAPSVSISESIQGATCAQGEVISFLGLPYAEPPVGELRFLPPQPFRGNLDGTFAKAAPSCLNLGGPYLDGIEESEDCLYMDIYVPANVTQDSKLPVKVFLYGDDNVFGGISNPLYNGCALAELGDSIIVVPAYRRGVLGNFALMEAGFFGNYGLQDQVLALEWVQENIDFFGGNPEQVLLFGQGSGATDAYIISSLPNSKEIISSAVFLSGGGRDIQTITNVQTFMEQVTHSISCQLTDADCIRSTSLETFNETITSLPQPGVPFTNSLIDSSANYWGPVVDCRIIPNQPSEIGSVVPSIFGSSFNDGSLSTLQQYANAEVSESDYHQFLSDNFGSYAEQISQQYSLNQFSGAQYPIFEAVSSVVTDYSYRCPAQRGALFAASKQVDVWSYSFDLTPSCSWSSQIPEEALPVLGATYSADVPFFFGNLEELRVNNNCHFSGQEQEVSYHLASSLTALAVRNNPAAAFNWPQFTSNSPIGLTINNNATLTAGNLNYGMCDFWNQLDASILQNTTSSSEFSQFCPSANNVSPNANNGGNNGNGNNGGNNGGNGGGVSNVAATGSPNGVITNAGARPMAPSSVASSLLLVISSLAVGLLSL